MAVNYTNRRKDKYFAKIIFSKKGNIRYYPVKENSKLNPKNIAEKLPENFEFYEHPYDAKVVIRKKFNTTITLDEVGVLENIMKKADDGHGFIIDREKNCAIIYIGRIRFEDFPEFGENFNHVQTYNSTLRFEKSGNFFKAQRFSYLTRFYGWITMETNENLSYLAEKYCPLIFNGRLLDYWIEGENDW